MTFELAVLKAFVDRVRGDLRFPGLGAMPVCRWIIVQEQRLDMQTGME